MWITKEGTLKCTIKVVLEMNYARVAMVHSIWCVLIPVLAYNLYCKSLTPC